MRTRALVVFFIFGLAISACDSKSTEPKEPTAATQNYQESAVTQNFIANASSVDHFGIMSGKMALARSQSAAAQQVAHRLVTDHTHTAQQMASLIATKGIPVPTQELLQPQQEEFEKLQNARNFDFVFLKVQAKAHRDAIEVYQNYIQGGDDPDFRNLAAETLPVIREHLRMIMQALDTIRTSGH